MLSKRVIPVLLINNKKLIHRINYKKKNEIYVGDPLNAIKVFNDLKVHELILMDVSAGMNGKIDFDFLRDLSSEAFFPISYGGGINNFNDAKRIISLGFDKIIINKNNFINLNFLTECSKLLGAQSVLVNIDVIKLNNKYYIYDCLKNSSINIELKDFLNDLKKQSFGEILISSVNNDGTFTGCDLQLIRTVCNQIDSHILYKGGLNSYDEILKVLKEPVSAVCASSLFIMKKKNGGIILNYPSFSAKDLLQ
jgi:cyclase